MNRLPSIDQSAVDWADLAHHCFSSLRGSLGPLLHHIVRPTPHLQLFAGDQVVPMDDSREAIAWKYDYSTYMRIYGP